MRYITKILLAFCLTIFLTMPFTSSKASAINLFGNPCSKPSAQNSPVCKAAANGQDDTKTNNSVLRTINAAVNIITVVAGLAAVIMIMVAGFSYVTSGGSSDEAKKARDRIIYAAVGLVIIAFAWTITRFVTDQLL